MSGRSVYALPLILLILAAWGCLQWRKGPWKVVGQIDADSTVKIDQLLFLDARRGFAFGHTEPEWPDPSTWSAVNEIRTYQAWVRATTDGGLTWQQRTPLGLGYVPTAIKIPNGPIMLILRTRGKEDWHSAVSTSTDDGMTWSKQDFAMDLVSMEFVDASRGFVWGNGPGPELLYTEDGARTLQPIELPPHVVLSLNTPAMHPDGSFFYPNENKIVHLIRLPDGRWREEIDTLPASLVKADMYINTNDPNASIWIIATEAKVAGKPNDIAQNRLLRWDGPGKIVPIPGLTLPYGYMVDDLFQFDSVVTISGADYSGQFTFSFASHSVFRSKNAGKSWRSEATAIGAKPRAVTFYGREVWSAARDNRLQHRKP